MGRMGQIGQIRLCDLQCSGRPQGSPLRVLFLVCFITESFSVKRLIDPSLRFGMTWGVSFRWNSCSLVKLRIKTDLPCTDLLPQFQAV